MLLLFVDDDVDDDLDVDDDFNVDVDAIFYVDVHEFLWIYNTYNGFIFSVFRICF